MKRLLLASLASLALVGCVDPDAGNYLHDATAIDGDTIISGNEHIRLLRIDAPELPDHPCPQGRRSSCVDNDPVWAGESRRYLQDILDSHRVMCLRDKKDVYGRSLAECYIIDRNTDNINNLMLTSGMAQPYRGM